jgi:ABC-type multidrug transport system ATPase subunit
LGYCPQFDAITPLMTGRENLFFYARVKGIPEEDIPSRVDQLVHQLDLIAYENQLCGTYSGGNKRKLSVAIALVGNPPIVMLDGTLTVFAGQWYSHDSDFTHQTT